MHFKYCILCDIYNSMMVPGDQNIFSHLSVQNLIFLIFSLNDF